MTKKKFFASLGVLTAVVCMGVAGAALMMGNAASPLEDKVQPASAAVSLASSSSDWQNGAVVGGAMWKLVTGNYDYTLANCPECGVEDGYGDYTSIIFESVGGCTYSYTHLGVRGQNVHSGTIQIHNGEAFSRPSTCTTAGAEGVRCADCGAETALTTIPALGHSYDSGVSVEASQIYCGDTKYTCAMCGTYYYAKSGTSARTAHETVVQRETAATCITNGSKTIACTECDYQWTEDMPMIDHTPGSAITTKQPTCTEIGESVINCSFCGVQIESVPIPVLGHQIVEIPAVEPTCTQDGTGVGSKCARCDEIIVEPAERPALGHAWSAWDDDRVNCDEVGTRTRTCNRCQETEVEDIPAGEHTWDLGTITQQPTCTASGVREYTCILCGDKQTEMVEATGHKGVSIAAVSPTCTEPGLTEGSECTLCGIVLEAQQVIPAKGHDLDHVAAVEPTTTSEGNIEYWQCKTCGAYFSDRNGVNEIDLEDTVLDRLPATDDPTDDPVADDEEGMSGWQIALAVVAGVILLAAVGLLIDKFVINKDGNSVYDRAVNKVKSKSNKR